jgi:hypothetical protein
LLTFSDHHADEPSGIPAAKCCFLQENDSMSAIGALTSGMTHAMMMKPPPGPPPGAQSVKDNDGDSDGGASSGASSVGKLVNLSA